MTCDPVTNQRLDDRYQYVVVNGPSWERLCDGLKYQDSRDHVEIEFTYLHPFTGCYDEQKIQIRGRVCGIEGTSSDPSVNPLVKFIPETDCSTEPVPWTISYWPNRRQGHITDMRLAEALQPAP